MSDSIQHALVTASGAGALIALSALLAAPAGQPQEFIRTRRSFQQKTLTKIVRLYRGQTSLFVLNGRFSDRTPHRTTHAGRTFLTPFFRGKAPLFWAAVTHRPLSTKKSLNRAAAQIETLVSHLVFRIIKPLFAIHRRQQLLASDPGRLVTAPDKRREMPAVLPG
jgi:hypothetical protein